MSKVPARLPANVYPAAIRDVIASFAPATNGPLLTALAQAIEARLRDKLIFRARIDLVANNTLPRYQYKAKLVRELYREQPSY